MTKYPLVLASFRSERWAITPDWYANLERILEERSQGVELTPEARADFEAKSYGSQIAPQPKQVAVLQVYGPIVPRADLFSDMSALASHQGIAQALRAAADDDSVSEIVVDMDSPGGAVSGIDVSVEAMRYATSKKPVTVVTEGAMASAAYWIASQATRLVASPTAIVGSISILAEHRDVSEAQRQAGLKTTMLATGKWKTLGNSVEPLTDEGKDKLLSEMMVVHDLFVSDIAEGRKVTPTQAQDRWADGDVWVGANALSVGLVDEVATMQQVLDGITKPRASQRRKGTGAKMDLEQLKAEHPELYEQIMAQGRSEGKTQAETETALQASANQSGTALEQEVVRLRAAVESQQEETRAEKRKNIASNALESADLPKAGKVGDIDLDASFRAHVEGLSLNASSDEEARTKVEAAIAERRALMGEKKGEKKERRAFLPSGDTNADTEQHAAAQPTLNRARRSMGLR